MLNGAFDSDPLFIVCACDLTSASQTSVETIQNRPSEDYFVSRVWEADALQLGRIDRAGQASK